MEYFEDTDIICMSQKHLCIEYEKQLHTNQNSKCTICKICNKCVKDCSSFCTYKAYIKSLSKQDSLLNQYFKEQDNLRIVTLYDSKPPFLSVKISLPKPKSSWHLTEWVAKYSNLKGNSRLVSILIATYYNSTTFRCNPSYSAIQKSTGLSKGTIVKAVHEIEHSREWIVMPPRGSSRSNSYFPNPRGAEVPDGYYSKRSLREDEECSNFHFRENDPFYGI